MSGTLNPWQAQPWPDPVGTALNPFAGAFSGRSMLPAPSPTEGIAPSPTWADAMDATGGAVKAWRDAQRQKSVDMGVLNPETGWPTPQGWQAAGHAAAAGMGTNNVGMIRAYHGSPHSFDRFDMSKIGTGEGAQAYGHGLYFAGNEGVARGYRDRLAQPSVGVGSGVARGTGLTGTGQNAAKILTAAGGDWDAAIARAKAINPAAADTLQSWRDMGFSPKPPEGSMYEVNLHTDPSKLLDWDKPLGAQAIRQSLPDAYPQQFREQMRQSVQMPDISGKTFYHGLAASLPGVAPKTDASYAAASTALRDAGIHGIQYLDAGSRGAGTGSHNYAIFNPQIIEILRKYGIIPPVVAGAATQQGQQ